MAATRKPTARERAAAQVTLDILKATVIGWIVWSPCYSWRTGLIGSGREASIPDILAILGVLAGLVIAFFTGIVGIISALVWLAWAMSAPPCDPIDAIDERRI